MYRGCSVVVLDFVLDTVLDIVLDVVLNSVRNVVLYIYIFHSEHTTVVHVVYEKKNMEFDLL